MNYNEKLGGVLNIKRALASNISSAVFQVVLIGSLGLFVYYLGGFIIGLGIWGISGKGIYGVTIAPIISAILSYILYAIGWFLFWRVSNPDGNHKWLYTRILIGWIPLIAYLLYFRPISPDPMAMQLVAVPNQFIFSTVVTATILFPLYSVWVNRYALNKHTRNQHKIGVHCGFCALITTGVVVYLLAWHTMNLFYK